MSRPKQTASVKKEPAWSRSPQSAVLPIPFISPPCLLDLVSISEAVEVVVQLQFDLFARLERRLTAVRAAAAPEGVAQRTLRKESAEAGAHRFSPKS